MNDYLIYLLAQQREAELQRKQRDRERWAHAGKVAQSSPQARKWEDVPALVKRWLNTSPIRFLRIVPMLLLSMQDRTGLANTPKAYDVVRRITKEK